MPILPGRRLGPYEILSAIGAGGMGEVYKARDTRLDRTVAIKVLPTHLANRSELRERFEREAKTIASLNHPHICTLYDTGHQDGIDFLVMEYLEGETLAQRLLKGSLPIQQVLQYAIEISDALDKAHRKGITHRDLKPGNIMLTKTGTKLLDFGLAKLKQDVAPAIPDSQLATMRGAITGEGTILGTLQYMAPEQVEAKEVDARTDIFAFGTVVYEMATGKKAFEGKTSASVMAAILKDEPPAISSLQPVTPPALDRVVKTCMAKETDERWQTGSDLCRELKWIAEGGSQAGMPVAATTAKPATRSWQRTPVLGMAAVALLALSGISTWVLRPAAVQKPQPVTRTVIDLPSGDRLAAQDFPAITISPDGTQLAYVAFRGGTRQIFLRPLGGLEARAVSGTEGPNTNTPFFSPDGQWLGFFGGGKLRKVSVNGGSALPLTDVSVPLGASWDNQGRIIFSPSTSSAIQQLADEGGSPEALMQPKTGEGYMWPEVIPGGKALLFGTFGANARIDTQLLSSGKRRNLIAAGTSPRCVASGHLLYTLGANLMAAPFDAQRLQTTGTSAPVANGIMETAAGAQYSVSETGTLVYVNGSAQAGEKLVWVNRDGKEQPLSAPPHVYSFLRLSPDGRRLATTIAEQETQIWLYDFARETLSRFTFGQAMNRVPTWTPDGKRIAFNSGKGGPQNIYWQMADGSSAPERLTTGDSVDVSGSFSADGQLLAFFQLNPPTGFDISVLHLSDRKVEPFLQTQFNEAAPSFSPDGHWLAYISDESGRYEVYVRPYPGPGGKYQISTEGSTEPVWNRNGRELFYRSGDKMMAVDVTTRPSFSVGQPKLLFHGPYLPSAIVMPYYDVSPDGQRFIMIKPGEQNTSLTQIVVVQNWFEELKQKVPTGKK